MPSQITSNKLRSLSLLFFFIFFICFLAYVYGEASGGQGFRYLPFGLGLSVLSAWAGYYYSDRITLAISRAHELKRVENPEIYQLVEKLCRSANLPVPHIYLIADKAPNAFATGRNPEKAVLALTSGIIEKLSKTELEGVIAHELSHIKNYDIRIMTLAVVFAGIIALLSDWFLRFSFYSSRSRDSRGQSQLQAFLIVIGLLLALLSPLIALLLRLALSRRREFLADASAAMLTHCPEGLASALEKISTYPKALQAANKATAHLYIVNPLSHNFISKLFSTHPPVVERVQALRSMIG